MSRVIASGKATLVAGASVNGNNSANSESSEDKELRLKLDIARFNLDERKFELETKRFELDKQSEEFRLGFDDVRFNHMLGIVRYFNGVQDTVSVTREEIGGTETVTMPGRELKPLEEEVYVLALNQLRQICSKGLTPVKDANSI